MERSPLLREAHDLAKREHAGQSRKANATPYLRHVVAVAEVLAEAGFDDEVVAAALLHDTVEHTSLDLAGIRTRFGDRVGALVGAMTDRDEIESWEDRKAEHRERVRASGREASAIYAADKLCGIREARDGYAEVAEDVEERLGASLDQRLRIWEEDLRMAAAVAPPLPFTSEIARELRRLRSDRDTSVQRT
jgi:(p)ppGpp synthase/HD superfamily hydrolase